MSAHALAVTCLGCSTALVVINMGRRGSEAVCPVCGLVNKIIVRDE